MNMTQYAGDMYLNLEDVRGSGPKQLKIEAVEVRSFDYRPPSTPGSTATSSRSLARPAARRFRTARAVGGLAAGARYAPHCPVVAGRVRRLAPLTANASRRALLLVGCLERLGASGPSITSAPPAR
jgi:hypothetical protein